MKLRSLIPIDVLKYLYSMNYFTELIIELATRDATIFIISIDIMGQLKCDVFRNINVIKIYFCECAFFMKSIGLIAFN